MDENDRKAVLIYQELTVMNVLLVAPTKGYDSTHGMQEYLKSESL